MPRQLPRSLRLKIATSDVKFFAKNLSGLASQACNYTGRSGFSTSTSIGEIWSEDE